MLCSNNPSFVLKIPVGARSSSLSRAQVKEVLQALKPYYPLVEFSVHYLMTIGDHDQASSLRSLDKTNFFTKEIDEGLLEGRFRLGIHSAKDLPAPLPRGLALICLTQGVDPADVLVLRSNETLESLPFQARIATSSIRREESVKQLRPDLTFCDLRGTIDQRLAKLDCKEADGVVVAEAALIRLELTHLNRIRLPGKTVEGQGQLAILAREEDKEMENLFSCLDSRLLA
jgi:hydroxymethylbilane synthase